MNTRYHAAAALLGAFILFAAMLHAQPAEIQVNFSKDRPAQLFAYRGEYTDQYKSWYEKKLRKTGFSDAEAAEIMNRISAGSGVPAGLLRHSSDAAMLARYKAYIQYSVSRLGYHYAIIWLPQDENRHMPEELRPTADAGTVLLIDATGLTTEGKDKKGQSLPLAGTAPEAATRTAAAAGNNSGISHSKADMSAFTSQFSQGVMALYYGSGGAVSTAYLYELKGPALSDKPSVADALGAKISSTQPFIGFELISVGDCGSAERYIQKKAGNSIRTICSGTHPVK